MSEMTTPADDPNAVLSQLQRLSAALDRRALDDAIDAGTAGVAFASDAARDQARALLRGQLRVADGTAVAADGRGGPEFVRAAIAKTEFAHFRRAGVTRGGSLMGGHQPTPVTPADAQPRTLGEVVLLRARQAQQEQRAPADPTAHMSVPFGLKPIR